MSLPFPALRIARGLSVLVMPSIHTVMLYSQPAVHQTILGLILRFFAECISSHLYMFLMGFYVATGTRKPWLVIIHRGASLLAAGYLLNGLRTYLPAQAGMLPAAFLAHYGASETNLFPLLLTGDILQFAGIAYTITAALERCRVAARVCTGAYLVIAITAPFCWGVHVVNPWLNHLLQLFASDSTQAFFPVLPWLCYPLSGLVAGKWYLQRAFPFSAQRALWIGLGAILTGCLISQVSPAAWEPDFYRNGSGGTLLHTGLVGLWLVFIHAVYRSIALPRVAELLSYADRHITRIYFIHWILVGWGTGLFGYQALSLYPTCLALFLVNGCTVLALWFFQRIYTPAKSLITN